MSTMSGHVASDRLGEAARHATLEFLRDPERRHVEGCQRCRRLYGGYRLTDRLLASPWRDVKLPPETESRPSRLAVLPDFVAGFGYRRLAPMVALAAVLLLIVTALAAPQLLSSPTASSPSIAPSTTPSLSALLPGGTPLSSGQASSAPGAQASGPGNAPSQPPGPTPAASPTPISGPVTLAVTRIGGDPLAWSPDGQHLLAWAGLGKLQVRDDLGRAGGSINADAGAWFTATTFAVAARGYGGHGVTAETVTIVDTRARVVSTVPGDYFAAGAAWAMLLGSGNGELTIATQGGRGSPGWHFVLWNGSLSASHEGLPVAFSADGRRLAVLHPSGVSGASVTGWLEILSAPNLTSVAQFKGLSLRVGPGSMGSSYGFDAAFSPDSHYLLASGTLVDLTRGSTTATGKGGWLPDGTLVTASNGGLLRWRGTRSGPDPRFPGAGTVEASRHGELVYFYGDGRPPLFLDTNGALDALTLDGVGSIGSLLISPGGHSIALDGRATDGSSIAAVATLP